jgi:predicted ATP-grasp superfamily ATP-dependent carboligase
MQIFVYEYTCAAASEGTMAPSLHREGAAMLAALLDDFAALPEARVVTIVGEGRQLPLIRRAQKLGYRFQCLPVRQESERSVFCSLSAVSDWSIVVAPETDNLLETRMQWVQSVGGRALGCNLSAIQLAADKLTCATYLRHRSVSTPHCVAVGADQRHPSLDFPFVWKPRFGAGSQATFLIRRQEDWPAAREAIEQGGGGGGTIAQPFIDGQAVSVSFLVSERWMIPLIAGEQLLSNDGRFRYLGGRLPLSPSGSSRAVALAGRAIGAIPGLLGYVGVDLVLAENDEDQVIDINPRITTSYIGLRMLSRTNLAEGMLAAANKSRDPPLLSWQSATVTFQADGRVFREDAH